MIYVGSLGFFRCCRFDFLGVVAPVTPNEFPNVVDEPVINYYYYYYYFIIIIIIMILLLLYYFILSINLVEAKNACCCCLFNDSSYHILSYCYYLALALLHSDSHFIFSFT